jgi:hypothetical protein
MILDEQDVGAKMATSRVFPAAASLALILSACASPKGQGTSSVEMLDPLRETTR